MAQRLIIVSNRLPVAIENGRIQASSGGLVTALKSVFQNRGGAWIGSPGTAEISPSLLGRLVAGGPGRGSTVYKPVLLSEAEMSGFYRGFANEILWPLFHDFSNLCVFEPSYWEAYTAVNKKFALAVADFAAPEDYVWVHDYHLLMVAKELRAAGVRNPLGFFLHIPFPAVETFLRLPWRAEILEALTHFDLIGFQIKSDRRNFLNCLQTLFRGRVTVRGKGPVVQVRLGDRSFRAGYFPIGIDSDDFERMTRRDEVVHQAQQIHESLSNQVLFLGIDRLDYTKGLPERLKAFRTALENYPELLGRITLVQVVVPSREDIPRYHDLLMEVERLVGEINGRFGRIGWVPIHYLHRHLQPAELYAYYRAADVALVTPLKDGMNLVAKEFCACSTDGLGILILSEFAGSAFQLGKAALLVNPFDIRGTAETIRLAVAMPTPEIKKRMTKLRHCVRKYDIHWWVDDFLKAAFAKHLQDFPVLPHDNELNQEIYAVPMAEEVV